MRIRRLIPLALVFVLVAPIQQQQLRAASASYETGVLRWRSVASEFAAWTLTGTMISAGAIQLNPTSAASESDPYPPLGYNGHNFYNGGTYQVGEATSPQVAVSIPVRQAIASWNADTPAGTWIEMLVRAQVGTRWTKWYNLGVWASGTSTVERHSVAAQGDADGYVSVDTLVLDKKVTATALQVKARLFTASGMSAIATLRNVGLAFSADAPKKVTPSAGDPARWNVLLSVPTCSQMVYPDGGTVWCSPTSTSMVLGYWNKDTGPCEPRVRAAVTGVYDWVYDGHGNWPFNTAYAAGLGFEAYVVRFSSMAQLEPWVTAGVPVIISYAWKGNLTGAPLPSSPGHLAVIVGFDASGNPIVNDPAASTDADVQRTYLRSELESLWLTSSGGASYVIFPTGHTVPAF